MKLTELFSKVTSLEGLLSGLVADKTKATADSIAAVATGLTELKTGALATLADTDAKLTTANGLVASGNSNYDASTKCLRDACLSLKLDVKENASHADMVGALENAVSSTLAKLNVKSETIPNPKPANGLGEGNNSKTRAEFEQLLPAARMAFIKSGGKVTE